VTVEKELIERIKNRVRESGEALDNFNNTAMISVVLENQVEIFGVLLYLVQQLREK
jgi:hypothetical protein